MIILTIRTDKPEAELGLYDGLDRLDSVIWTAHRQLAETLHHKIHDMLEANHKSLHDISGIACYAGPGSFTGLRIGLSTGNALAYALEADIVAVVGEDWQLRAIHRLLDGDTDPLALPEYAADVHITPQKT